MKEPIKALEFSHCDVYAMSPKEKFIGTCRADKRSELVKKWCAARGLNPRDVQFKFDFKYNK